ncbi:MAG TPA: universal stress protein [Pirellulales bacterium]
MKALVGVDGSDGAWAAVQQTAELLPGKSEIVLYYAPPKLHFSGTHTSQAIADKARDSLAKAVFEEALKRIPDGLRSNISTIVGTQGPRRGLLLAAEQVNADFVAVGADGLGAARLLLGSVTRALLRHSTRPVLVARPINVRENRAPYRVLWAVDEPPAVHGPIDFLQKLAWPKGTNGSVIHVVDPLQSMEVPAWFTDRVGHDKEFARRFSEEYDTDKQRRFNEMAAFTSELPQPFGNLPILCEGNVANTVLQMANQEAADLVIVGTRDLGSVERFFLGSTAEAILQFARCSVLVVHMQAKP